MQVKILLLLVFLTLFGNSAFSGTYPDCVGTTDVGGCAAKPETTCENYFATMKDCGYKQCKWSASNCVSATKCKVDLRTTVTNCTPITVGTCTNYCKYTGGMTSWCKPCYVTGGATCTTNAVGYCKIPEFAGIEFEFSEMEISTGIIALIAAIALPTLLFRKKK